MTSDKVRKKFKANMENGTAIFQFPIDDMIASYDGKLGH